MEACVSVGGVPAGTRFCVQYYDLDGVSIGGTSSRAVSCREIFGGLVRHYLLLLVFSVVPCDD